MLATPDLRHLTAGDYDHVYEPAEDTFLFLDALEEDMEAILVPLSPKICLEIGSGSGCVSTFLAMHLKTPTLYLTTDINPRACTATRRTAAQNRVAHQLEPVRTDLTAGLFPRLHGAVDVLLFNPPYVPTEIAEVVTAEAAAADPSDFLAATWAGGLLGRAVTDRLLLQLPELIAPNGVAYLVLLQENKPDEIAAMMAKLGFNMTIVMRRRAGRERLMIARFSRKSE
ncbi:HemK methyltransferase member 2 [Allomyces arbusculus]|nr:HemK methyltransferase member 2 [Allomyces arbusculus]